VVLWKQASTLTVYEIFNGECDAMIAMTFIRPLNKGQGHSFWYQSISYIYHFWLPIVTFALGYVHRLATIHHVTDTDRRRRRRETTTLATLTVTTYYGPLIMCVRVLKKSEKQASLNAHQCQQDLLIRTTERLVGLEILFNNSVKIKNIKLVVMFLFWFSYVQI